MPDTQKTTKAVREAPTASEDRDGFAIRDFNGKEVHFVPCEYGGSQRGRVERGLLMKTREDLIVADTRWDR